MDKGFLSIVDTLKGFHTVLLGQQLKLYTNHKNLICKHLNTNHVLRWRLIPEQYGPHIEYITGAKQIVADPLSRFPENGNQETTNKSTYTMENMLELYNTKELPYDRFTLSFKLIYCYHQEYPFLTETLNAQNIKRFIFVEARIIYNLYRTRIK